MAGGRPSCFQTCSSPPRRGRAGSRGGAAGAAPAGGSRRRSAGLVEAQAADVEEADHEEDEEGDGDVRAGVDGHADGGDEVETEEDLHDGVDGPVAAVLLLLPGAVGLVGGGEAVLRRADELEILAEEALEDRAGVVDGEADAEG